MSNGYESNVQTSETLIEVAIIRSLLARQERRAATNYGSNRFQCPSEKTSTVPSTAWMAV